MKQWALNICLLTLIGCGLPSLFAVGPITVSVGIYSWGYFAEGKMLELQLLVDRSKLTEGRENACCSSTMPMNCNPSPGTSAASNDKLFG
jgi:hypothetical protein